MNTILGVPAVTRSFPGIDKMGQGCRLADSVTILRLPPSVPGRGIVLGDHVSIYDGVRLVLGNPGQHPDTGLTLGNHIIINTFCYLSGEGGLEIDDEVLIGSHVKILSAGHIIDHGDPSIWRNPLTYGKILIGRGAWIAAGAIILQGVQIGEGAAVGAASVVTRHVPAFAIVAGNPARIIRYRKGFEPQRPWYRWGR